MSPRRFWTAATTGAAAVFLTRWSFRSEFLFSWDSANYALAMERIDIATHRPHPPGYLGYVMTARGLDTILHNANAALVLWNIIAAALIVLVVMRIAWDIATQQPRPLAFVAAATSLVVTSPLLWFYSDVAEIFPSELLGTLVIGFCTWRAVRGDQRAIYGMALAIPVAAFFKLTAAVLMLPLAAFAWWRAPSRDRARAGALLAVCSVLAAGLFLATAPGLIDIIWNHFVTSTSSSRVGSAARTADAIERLNHNARDTLTAGISMLGFVNIIALVAWLIGDRKLPGGIDRATALLWTGPWIVLCVVIHIGKPGYILPVLPIATLILAGFYGRLRPALGVALIALQAVGNVAQFAVLGPLPESVTGGTRPYRSKTFPQRMASDMQSLTFATAATIRRNDGTVDRVLTTASRLCPSKNAIIITALDPLDARRVMWHLPESMVVHTEGRSVLWIGTGRTFREVAETTPPMTTACPVLWLSTDDKPPELTVPATARREPGVGLVIDARTVRVTPIAIVFEH